MAAPVPLLTIGLAATCCTALRLRAAFIEAKHCKVSTRGPRRFCPTAARTDSLQNEGVVLIVKIVRKLNVRLRGAYTSPQVRPIEVKTSRAFAVI